MSKKMICIDLDGTLMCDDKTISEKNRQAVHAILEKGHYVVFATGRAMGSVRPILIELGLLMPGVYVIAYNGAMVFDCSANIVLFDKRLPIEYAEYLFAEADRYGIYVQTYSGNYVLSRSQTKWLDLYISRTRMPVRIEPDIWAILNEEPPKVLLLDEYETLVRFQKAHSMWVKGRCESFFSAPQYLEYCPLGATKGNALTELRKFLMIPYESTYAVGDQENDISMIQKAYTGIAMSNAADKVKAAAEYVTENDNNHDAIAEVIQRFFLS